MSEFDSKQVETDQAQALSGGTTAEGTTPDRGRAVRFQDAGFHYVLPAPPGTPAFFGLKGVHPVALLFPQMSGEDLEALYRDIGEHGQREPILVHKGVVLDGRNRVWVLEQMRRSGLKVTPMLREYDGPTDAASLRALVVSLNLTRRHLTASQRAAIALELLPQYEAEAKARLRTSTGGKHPRPTASVPDAAQRQVDPSSTARDEEGEAREHAARALGVSPRYVSDLKTVRRTAPNLVELVRMGALTVPQAVQRTRGKPSPRAGGRLTKAAMWNTANEAATALVAVLLALKDRGAKPDTTAALTDARKVAAFLRLRVKPTTSEPDGCLCNACEDARAEGRPLPRGKAHRGNGARGKQRAEPEYVRMGIGHDGPKVRNVRAVPLKQSA